MYGYQTTPAPALRNHAEALACYHSIKPIRGRAEDVRPIAKRSDDNRRILLNPDGSVACRLYYTDVVTFHENQVEVQLNGYNTQSTVLFMNDIMRLSPVQFMKFNHKVWAYAKTADRSQGGFYPLPNRGSVWFEQDSTGAFSILRDPQYPVVHRVNRKQTNSVRKQYAPFKQHIRTMLRLRDNEVQVDEYGEVFGWLNDTTPNMPAKLEVREYLHISKEALDSFIDRIKSDEPEDKYRAFLQLVAPLMYVRSRGWKYNIGESDALRNLDNLIMLAHRDECFVEETITTGEQVTDRYSAFFSVMRD